MSYLLPPVAYRMKPVPGLRESAVNRVYSAPTLLVTLQPWWKVFFGNLADLVWPQPPAPLQWLSSTADFWPDVFVASRLPWPGFLQSALYHVLVIAALWGSSRILPTPPRLVDRTTFSRADVIYFPASEYLPSLDTLGPHKGLPKAGDPAYAPQPILSVSPEADNRSQTIVTPPDIKLKQDVPLPNIVAWSHTNLPVPLAATARSAADLKLPVLPSNVVAPPPDVSAASQRRPVQAVQPAIVEPPPSVEAVSTRKVGDLNIGHTEVVAPAPQLPMPEQRALAMAQGAMGNAKTAAVPPPPSTQGMGTANGGGRLIALGIHPVSPTAPIEVPPGNRRGTFAAGPEGSHSALGTASPGAESGGTNGHSAGGGTDGVPPGLFVGKAPNGMNSSAVAGHPGDDGTGNGSAPAHDSELVPNVSPSYITNSSRHPATELSETRVTDLDKKVFGDRKLYSMALNMPNLNSAGGSWLVRFAELKQNGERGELVAPVATQKVDPAYPMELMRRNVEGTVTLYAVIHSDGSVGDVRVLRGVDDRLDEYALAALSRWHFLPATKNGRPVALEAVVIIPFRAIRSKF